jgi:hypothetical protein
VNVTNFFLLALNICPRSFHRTSSIAKLGSLSSTSNAHTTNSKIWWFTSSRKGWNAKRKVNSQWKFFSPFVPIKGVSSCTYAKARWSPSLLSSTSCHRAVWTHEKTWWTQKLWIRWFISDACVGECARKTGKCFLPSLYGWITQLHETRYAPATYSSFNAKLIARSLRKHKQNIEHRDMALVVALFQGVQTVVYWFFRASTLSEFSRIHATQTWNSFYALSKGQRLDVNADFVILQTSPDDGVLEILSYYHYHLELDKKYRSVIAVKIVASVKFARIVNRFFVLLFAYLLLNYTQSIHTKLHSSHGLGSLNFIFAWIFT